VPWSRGQSYRLDYPKKPEDRSFIAKDQLDPILVAIATSDQSASWSIDEAAGVLWERHGLYLALIYFQ
jgi:hypothetical protein